MLFLLLLLTFFGCEKDDNSREIHTKDLLTRDERKELLDEDFLRKVEAQRQKRITADIS